jgi:N utilization substance protein B
MDHKKKPSSFESNRMSRLMAVQGAYEMDMTTTDVRHVLEHVKMDLREDMSTASPDEDLLKTLINHWSENREEIDEMIQKHLKDDWTVSRLESILQSILRIGATELKYYPHPISGPVIIMEYVQIAHGFYRGPEPKMVNGVLDGIARYYGRMDK